MERLTKRDRGGNARMDCDKCGIKYREGCCSTKLCRNALIDRLADYEDAEEQGLLVRLNESERKEFDEWRTKRAKH